MRPEEAKYIYTGLYRDLTIARSDLSSFRYNGIGFLDNLKAEGYASLLPSYLRKKLESFYKDFNEEYRTFVYLQKIKEIAKKHNVSDEQDSKLLRNIFEGKTTRKGVKKELQENVEFWEEIEKLRAESENLREELLLNLDKELLPKLTEYFSEDLMALEERKDILTGINILAFVILILVTYWYSANTERLTNAQIDYLTPKIQTEVTVGNYPYGQFDNFTYAIEPEHYEEVFLNIPIYVKIHNEGSVPVTLYNVLILESNCSSWYYLPLLGGNRVIDDGTSIQLFGNITIMDLKVNENKKTIKELLPCKILVVIAGSNFYIEKQITLIE